MMILSLITLCLAAIYFGIILALRIGLSRLDHCAESQHYRISIIVAMKNEKDNVRSCLEALINQTYPKELSEIIIVDDGSTDETTEILQEYQEQYSFLKVIQNQFTPSGLSSKKFALNKAIDNSTGEILLFTDADCVPPIDWAYAITSCFSSEVGLVAGFSPLIDPNDSILGELLFLDSLVNGVVAAGNIGLSGASTCTGRNLAYRHEVYDQVNGFEKIKHSVSGDDDLLLQLVHKETSWKTRFANDKDAVVPSYQTMTLKQFFAQKRRHLSAGRYYNLKLQIMYLLFHLANLSLFAFLVISIIVGRYVLLAGLLLAAKFIVDWLLLIAAGNNFNIRIKCRYFLLWELFYIAYHLIIAPTSWIGKIRW